MKKKSVLLLVGITVIFCTLLASPRVNADISPTSLTATLHPGESVSETKSVLVPSNLWTWLTVQDYPYDNITLDIRGAWVGTSHWLASVSPSSRIIPFDDNTWHDFDITITVPPDTTPDVYEFDVEAFVVMWNGTDIGTIGTQDVAITVTPQLAIPEVPYGTLTASVAAIVGLAAFAALPRTRRRI